MVVDRLMKMGNVDEAVSGTFTQAQVNEALAHLQHMPQVQAATGIVYLPRAARIFSERTALSNADQYVYGVPPSFDQVYGPLTDNQGRRRHFADLGPRDVFVSSTVAHDEDVRAGDRLQFVFEEQSNETLTVTVRAVLATDLAVTDGELEFDGSYPEIILPLSTVLSLSAQTHFLAPVPNVICVKNVGRGGLDDTGPDGTRGQPVLDYLAQFFHAAPDARGFFPTYFDSVILHPLKPQIAESQGNFSPLDNKWESFIRGPLCMLAGVLLFTLTARQDETWMQQLSVALLIGGGGLLLSWLLTLLRVPVALAGRLGLSLIGLGWLVYGIWTGKNLLLIMFASDVSVLGAHAYVDASPPEVLFSLLLPLVGTVLLVMSNVDLLGRLLAFLLRRVRSLAPVSRTGLAYPLTFRFRNGVTLALLSLIIFLVILVVANNLSSIQQSSIQTTTGTFQLEIDGVELDALDPAHTTNLNAPLLATPRTLRQEIALVTRMRFAYDPHHARPIRLSLPGNPMYTSTKSPGPFVVDDTFLSNTTMPLFVRARGYGSDRQVWDTVRDRAGYAVLQYIGNIGLPTSQGFAPFTASVPQTGDPHAPYRRVTVIGLLPSNAYWGTMFFSEKTEASIGATPYDRFTFYYFRLQPGVSVTQAASALNNELGLNRLGIALNSLVQDTLDAYTASLTLFLASYLAMGLLFGAFSIGVITSRAVVERRQQIGMLRALGFSRGLVQRSFLLEASFVITLSLLAGSLLAWWLAYQITSQAAQTFPFPLGMVVLLLAGSYLVAVLCTVPPARRASRVPPAEALRYE